MSDGVLLFPPGHTPLYEGAPVPSGKIAFYRTGTSTPQNVYSDSTLSTPITNPLTLDASGMLQTLVYFDPTTGFDYRIELLTSASVSRWILDDVLARVPDEALSANVPLLDASNTFLANQVIESALPQLIMKDTDSGSNQKAFAFAVDAGQLFCYSLSDAGAFVENWLTVNKNTSGEITQLSLAGDAILLNGVTAAGSGTLATNATTGFLYVPTCAGTPTGTPAGVSGYAPIVVDTTNSKLYFYSNGAWRDAGP